MTLATHRAPSPVDQAVLDRAVGALGGRIAVLTGAGISTDSGIPDYRGDGAPVRRPMTIQQFRSAPSFQQRYWAGSYLGWGRFAAALPNAGHLALAGLERDGRVVGVVTQNVDGLHGKAGSLRVVEVHGSGDRVLCLDCGQVLARDDVTRRIEAANPWIVPDPRAPLNPDGDAAVDETDGFVLPTCTVCGGILKPDVVFFGEFVPPDRFQRATALVRGADALLVAGSSLAVNSGIRLLEQARRQHIPIVVVNRGTTKGDRIADVKVDAGTSETLQAIRERLTAAAA